MERKTEQGTTAFLYLIVTVVILESGAFLSLNYWQEWRLDNFRSKIFHSQELLSMLEAGCSHEGPQPNVGQEIHSRPARRVNTLFGFMKDLLNAQQKALQAVCTTRPDLCIYGKIGLSGLQGPTGIKGLSGATGPKGPKGDIGLTGPGGQKGIVGIKGPTGPKGDAGSLGQKGIQGPKGQSGVSGLKGDPGLRGDNATAGGVGEKGRAGHKGQLGIKGQKGESGVHGEMGVEGIPGAKGEPGKNGYNGIVLHSECECLKTNNCDCDFESPCSWKNITDIHTDNMDWTLGKGPTPTFGTGPNSDHTLRNANGSYIYLETSSGAPGYHAMLLSEPLSTSQRFCLTFWYYMSGPIPSMGHLDVRIKKAGVILTPIWKVSGSQGSLWHLAKVDVPPQPVSYYLVLNAARGIDFYGDIAVDDIVLTDGACQ